MMEQIPFLEKRKKREEGDERRTPSRNQEEPGNHDGIASLKLKKEERRRETSPGTRAGTRRNQEIIMEENLFPEKRKKSKEGRQALEPEPEPEGTRSS